jgi:hypothetical protein
MRGRACAKIGLAGMQTDTDKLEVQISMYVLRNQALIQQLLNK